MTTQKRTLRSKLIGDRSFYRKVLMIAVPIMIQNGITNFVNLLDNIMVGRVGTVQMSGAAIVNQLLFVYTLCLFGGLSGAGIFTAQYYGQGDQEGVRSTFRFKLWLVSLLTIGTILLLLSPAGVHLIGFYLKGEGSPEDAAAILGYGLQYMRIMLLGLPAQMLGMVYSSTLRECGETVLPMKAGIAGVLVNLVFNYLLIYGKLGLPAMGVAGAAAATVLSRFVETLIIIIVTHRRNRPDYFTWKLYSTLKVPSVLVRRIIVKGSPLLFNETLWAGGMAMLQQCYSVRGLDVVAGMNIASTINNVFTIVFIALGDTVAIVVGQLLGAGEMEEAKRTDTKMIAFSVFCSSCVAIVMLFTAPLFPRMYNTSDTVRSLARAFIMTQAAFMPMNAFLHACYFTLRSGGKTVITFLFDSVFVWGVSVPTAFILSRFTGLTVVVIFILVQAVEVIKCVIGFTLVKKGVWVQNIVCE